MSTGGINLFIIALSILQSNLGPKSAPITAPLPKRSVKLRSNLPNIK